MVLWRPIYKYIWFNQGSQEQMLEEDTLPLVLKDEGKLTKEGREQHFGQSTTFVSWWERVWWEGQKEGQSGRKRENKVGWRERRLEKTGLDHTGPRRPHKRFFFRGNGSLWRTGPRWKTGSDLTPDLSKTDLPKAQASWWYFLLKT